MKLRPLSRMEVRCVDAAATEQYGLAGICLMENAGRGAAEVIHRAVGGAVVILCGHGNNGGDGFVIARHLQNLGHDVQIIMLSQESKLQGDALANWSVAQAAGIPTLHARDPAADIAQAAGKAECLVDAMLGTGAVGEPRGNVAQAIDAANEVQALKIAIDLPSGLDCDTGLPAVNCFRADHTCTFVAPKIGFARPEAKGCLGQIHVVDIGVPRRLLVRFM